MMFEAMAFKVCPIHIKLQTPKSAVFIRQRFFYACNVKQILNFLKINK